MVLVKSLNVLFVLCSSISFVRGELSLQKNQLREDIQYSNHDVTDDWIPNKVNGIQDRFHPVTLHHVKPHPTKPALQVQPPPNPNTQAIFLSPNQQSFGDGFRNEVAPFPQEQISSLSTGFQVDPESHAGEIIPGLVNQDAAQSLDFPVGNINDYIAYLQSSTPAPSTSTPGDTLKTVYVPWIYIPPGANYKDTQEIYTTEKPQDSPKYAYPSPKPSYLPPEPNYLPPASTYLPPKPTYLPPEPTYLPPAYSYPAPTPAPTYLPPEPMRGYSYPVPPPLPEEEKEKAAEFTYFFLGRKLWYIPLYFSIYFVLYVGYLVLKAIARHKLKFPHLLHNAAVVSGRDLIKLGLYSSRDFNDMEELWKTITRAAEKTIQ